MLAQATRATCTDRTSSTQVLLSSRWQEWCIIIISSALKRFGAATKEYTPHPWLGDGEGGRLVNKTLAEQRPPHAALPQSRKSNCIALRFSAAESRDVLPRRDLSSRIDDMVVFKLSIGVHPGGGCFPQETPRHGALSDIGRECGRLTTKPSPSITTCRTIVLLLCCRSLYLFS